MDAHALDVLEFDAIRGLLAEAAASSLGVAAAGELAPIHDRELLTRRLAETTEARSVRDVGEDIPLGGLHDISPQLRTARLGGVLAGGDLLLVADTLGCIARLRAFFADRGHLRRLGELAAGLVEAPALAEAIDRCIGADGEVLDRATPELHRLRRQVTILSGRIESQLQKLLGELARDDAVQDAVITIREGRYCVPVKSSHRHRFDGLIHDRSASGQTVFMEPAAVVRLNNELREAQFAEREEVQRILTDLSRQVAAAARGLEGNLGLLAQLDAARSRGQLSLRLEASEPVLDDSGRWDLVGARHPLLLVGPKRAVQPIDVRLGDEFDVLLVTGPNTGGKTVALKTLGLLTLMALSGLHVPADAGSRIARVDAVYADIGDEQSIEQSLSTFGSHLRQVVAILDGAAPGDLVLLDELGAGTDPVEGAALAQAVLSVLLERGCRVMATTHHGVLKDFAYATERVENASVAFDKQSLKPLYRLLIGIPGASHAFDIAQRWGLSADVLARARELLPADHRDASEILGAMQASQRRLETELRDAEREAAGASHERRELERERRRLRDLEVDLRAEARREAADLLAGVQAEADQLLQQLRAAQREGKPTEQARRRLRELTDAVRERPASQVRRGPAVDPDALRPGDIVEVTRLAREGTVIDVADGELTIQVGPMRLNAPPSDVTLVRRGTPPKPPSSGRRDVTSWGVPNEIHLRGQLVDDALIELDRYIDQALLANLREVRIVHGKGTGTLRRAVREYLREHPHVERYSHPPENLGGQGVTVAVFK